MALMTVDTSWDRLIMKVVGADLTMHEAVNPVLELAAKKVKETAEEKFGTYQGSVGPFNGWAAMNSDYLAYKISKGGADTPLIGVSELNKVYSTPLKDTLEISLYPEEMRAEVGTNDPLGEWHEYGAARKRNYLPPRPFLRPALYQNRDWIVTTMAASLGAYLEGWFD